MGNKKNWLRILVMVLVFGITVAGCASYLELMDRTTPGWREQEPIKLFPDGSRSNNSPGTGSSQERGGSTDDSAHSIAQQPTSEIITRTYTFSVPNSGQAGGGASAVAKAEAEANASQRFRAENPGFEIRSVQSQFDGFGTLTVTITGRKSN